MYSKPFAYILWALSGFGCLGLHRFYLGKPATGILWLCTGGLFTIGSIYDLITLGSQVDKANMMAHLRKHLAEDHAGTRFARDASSRIIREKETPEHAILTLAKENKGIVSAPELALRAKISMDEAKKHLETMVTKGHAEMRVRSNGTLVFTINDFLEDGSDLTDL